MLNLILLLIFLNFVTNLLNLMQSGIQLLQRYQLERESWTLVYLTRHSNSNQKNGLFLRFKGFKILLSSTLGVSVFF